MLYIFLTAKAYFEWDDDAIDDATYMNIYMHVSTSTTVQLCVFSIK